MSLRRRISVPGLAAGLALGLVGAVSAGAEGLPVIKATVSPSVISSTGSHTLTLTLAIDNAGPAQLIDLSVSGASWPGYIGSLLYGGNWTLAGPGTLAPLPIPPPGPDDDTCVRGPAFDASSGNYSLELTADSTTTVTVPLSAVVPPWPGSNYTPLVSVQSATTNPVSVSVPRVTMTGPTGVEIELNTKPNRDTLPVGTDVTITGTTNPPVRHTVVELSADYLPFDSSAHTFRIGTVRTDAAGHFRLAGWRPRHAGYYRIDAAIPKPGSGLLPDSNCLSPITVGSAPTISAP